jgi:predicted O-methyltransferase YrrM/DNA-binding PadR family transcriptional regulator
MGRPRGHRGFHGFHTYGAGVRGRKLGSDDLQLLLLLLLSERPSHGYVLIRALEQRSAGFYVPSPGMVYPALTHLEELHYATVSVEGTRKLYQLAPPGRAYLQQHRATAEAVMRQLEHFGHTMFGFARRPSEELDPTTAPREPLVLGKAVDSVLERLVVEAEHSRPADGGPRRSGIKDPFQYADFGFSIAPEQGELIYLLCRTLRATRVVEFASSVGVSTLYLAAAMRDNGGGTVIGSEIVPAKIMAAQHNLATAELAAWVELRAGDARETLRNLGGPVDFALIDGWPGEGSSSLARQVVEIVAPQIRSGGMLVNTSAEADYHAWVRDPRNGFVSITLPIGGRSELSLKL